MKLKQQILNFLKKITNYNPLIQDENFILYLCGTEALPIALTDEEEKDLINKLETDSDYAKQKLIEHNLRLVVYISKKFENCGVELEDLISVGSIGLIKAINSFKIDKNIKIATYASKCIENEILMYLRKISKLKQEISIDEPINVDGEGNELALVDLMPAVQENPQKNMESSTEKKILWQVLKNLSKREQEIIVMRFGLNGGKELTQKEVADSLNISQSYISRLEKKIINRIKKEMSKLV